MMGHIESRGNDFEIDLESGGDMSEEDGSKDCCSSGEDKKKLLGRVWSGFVGLERSIRSVDGLSSCEKALNTDEIFVQNMEILSDKLGDEAVNSAGENVGKERRKKPDYEKPCKPPRPPRGPSLDAADMKLVKEISALAMLKRKRIERMKALKKMKADKGSSFNGNIFAMVITLLFCFIMFFQGLLGSRV